MEKWSTFENLIKTLKKHYKIETFEQNLLKLLSLSSLCRLSNCFRHHLTPTCLLFEGTDLLKARSGYGRGNRHISHQSIMTRTMRLVLIKSEIFGGIFSFMWFDWTVFQKENKQVSLFSETWLVCRLITRTLTSTVN